MLGIWLLGPTTKITKMSTPAKITHYTVAFVHTIQYKSLLKGWGTSSKICRMWKGCPLPRDHARTKVYKDGSFYFQVHLQWVQASLWRQRPGMLGPNVRVIESRARHVTFPRVCVRWYIWSWTLSSPIIILLIIGIDLHHQCRLDPDMEVTNDLTTLPIVCSQLL